MSNSLDLTIRASQIRQGIPTEESSQVIAKTAVVSQPEPTDESS